MCPRLCDNDVLEIGQIPSCVPHGALSAFSLFTLNACLTCSSERESATKDVYWYTFQAAAAALIWSWYLLSWQMDSWYATAKLQAELSLWLQTLEGLSLELAGPKTLSFPSISHGAFDWLTVESPGTLTRANHDSKHAHTRRSLFYHYLTTHNLVWWACAVMSWKKKKTRRPGEQKVLIWTKFARVTTGAPNEQSAKSLHVPTGN